MQLTQKEKELLKDLKGQEKLCVEKYRKHAECAFDGQLKKLFEDIASVEQQHLDTIVRIEEGETPTTGGGGSNSQPSFTDTYGAEKTQEKLDDSYLCSDLLATEKHASHLYDTCIFEFGDPALRNVLNHIQKEEQQHGEMLYGYMKANGMYA